MDSDPPSLTITCIRSLPVKSQLSKDVAMEEAAQMQARTLPLSARSTPRYTTGKIFIEFTYRRIGLIRAITEALPQYNHTGDEAFFGKRDQGVHSLYLYGNTDGSYELRQPKPKALLGINLVRGNLNHINWLQRIAMHGDAWLINISFSLGQHMKAKEREVLFNMINGLPTLYEIFLGSDTYHRMCSLEEKKNIQGTVIEKNNQLESEDEYLVIEKNNQSESEDEALTDSVVCPICDGRHHASAFWIYCDICNQWYHGKCVKITVKKAKDIKHYECPECFNDRIGHN